MLLDYFQLKVESVSNVSAPLATNMSVVCSSCPHIKVRSRLKVGSTQFRWLRWLWQKCTASSQPESPNPPRPSNLRAHSLALVLKVSAVSGRYCRGTAPPSNLRAHSSSLVLKVSAMSGGYCSRASPSPFSAVRLLRDRRRLLQQQ